MTVIIRVVCVVKMLNKNLHHVNDMIVSALQISMCSLQNEARYLGLTWINTENLRKIKMKPNRAISEEDGNRRRKVVRSQ